LRVKLATVSESDDGGLYALPAFYGQLHKGDAGNLFIQFTSDAVQDAAIPDEAGKPESSMTFNTLKLAQALGDRQALLDNHRRVIRFHLGTDVVGGLKRLVEALK
jgi:hypothetical protein